VVGTGGAVGTGGGSTGTGGTSAGSGILCPVLQALITDFTYAGTADTTQVRFTNLGGGGEYVYPFSGGSYPLTSDVTQNNWHISGTIGDYSSMTYRMV
jgi:hypothetical protein